MCWLEVMTYRTLSARFNPRNKSLSCPTMAKHGIRSKVVTSEPSMVMQPEGRERYCCCRQHYHKHDKDDKTNEITHTQSQQAQYDKDVMEKYEYD